MTVKGGTVGRQVWCRLTLWLPGPAGDTPRWRLTRDGRVQEEAAVAAGSVKTPVTLTPELILVT